MNCNISIDREMQTATSKTLFHFKSLNVKPKNKPTGFPVSPEQPTPVAYLPYAHAFLVKMIEEMREDEQHVVVHRRQQHLCLAILPHPHVSFRARVVLQRIQHPVYALRQPAAHGAMQFNLPFFNPHPQVFGVFRLLPYVAGFMEEHFLCLPEVGLVQQEIDIPAPSVQRSLITLGIFTYSVWSNWYIVP